MVWLLLGMLVWVVCGVLSYGLNFAFFQRKFPTLADEEYARDLRFAVITSFLGPVALFANLCACGIKHGLKWR